MILINTIKTIASEIEEINREIKRVPQECDIIEKDIKNIKSGILIYNKRTDGIKLDMEKNDKRIHWVNGRMDNLKLIYDNHQSNIPK